MFEQASLDRSTPQVVFPRLAQGHKNCRRRGLPVAAASVSGSDPVNVKEE